MCDPDWSSLPSVVLFDLYNILSLNDRLQVSSTCRKWRDAFYFYPNWRKLELNTVKFNKEKNAFLLAKGKKHCKSLTIAYHATGFTKVANMLKDWSGNHRVQTFQLVGSGSPYLKSFSSEFQNFVFPFLENCNHLASLYLSHFDDFDRFNKLIEKHPTTLIHLGVGKLCFASSTDANELPRTLNISNLPNLKILHLEGDWVTEDVILLCAHRFKNLKRLILTLRENNKVGKVPESAWDHLYALLPKCEIHVNYSDFAAEDNSSIPFILTKSQNITRLRLINCSPMFQEICVNVLMREHKVLHTIQSIWAIFDSRQLVIRHPYVVCAWRFKHLRELLISGAMFDDYDIIGMLRMRKKLNIRIAKEDVLVKSNSKSYEEFLKLVKEASDNPNWEPLDNNIFNNPSYKPAEREAAIAEQLLKEDLNIK